MHHTPLSCPKLWSNPLSFLVVFPLQLFKDDGSFKTTGARVRELLAVLARELDGPEDATSLLAGFDSHQNAEGDISVQLDSWIRASVGLYEKEPPYWLLVLRCVNQGIVFPAVFHMKKLFTDKFAYKDAKGTWKVRISILSKDIIEIQHRKGEKSQQTGPQDNFSFNWSMTFRLDLSVGDIDVSVSIIDYIFDKEMEKNIKAELLSAMQPFLSGSAPYIAIWRKPLRKLPVSRDFGRLCGRLSIFNHLGKPIFTRTPELGGAALVKRVLLTLADCFNPELIASLEVSLDKHLKDDGEMMEMLTRVLHEDKCIPEDSHLSNLLKCINTTIVFPAVDLLHSRIYEKIQYKDVRNTWSTHITLGPAIRNRETPMSANSSSSTIHQPIPEHATSSPLPSTLKRSSPPPDAMSKSSKAGSGELPSIGEEVSVSTSLPRYRYVSIIHRKVEQSYSGEAKEQFQFEWMVEFVMNREMHIKDVQLGVVDFSFGPHTTDDVRAQVLTCLKPFLRPSMLQLPAAALPSHDIIDLVTKKLEEMELTSHSLASGYHACLPHSMPLRTLLAQLKAAIPNSEVRLPSGEHISNKVQYETSRSPETSRHRLSWHSNTFSDPDFTAGNHQEISELNFAAANDSSKARHKSERPRHSPREINMASPRDNKSPKRKRDSLIQSDGARASSGSMATIAEHSVAGEPSAAPSSSHSGPSSPIITPAKSHVRANSAAAGK